MSRNYVRKTDRLNRSFDCVQNAGRTSDPYKLLAAAVIFQAAVDCENWSPELENPQYSSCNMNGLVYRRKGKLKEFINSDWIDLLLCWQHEIKPEAVCEELVRRMLHETISE